VQSFHIFIAKFASKLFVFRRGALRTGSEWVSCEFRGWKDIETVQ
jgi:hypothetical protein